MERSITTTSGHCFERSATCTTSDDKLCRSIHEVTLTSFIHAPLP